MDEAFSRRYSLTPVCDAKGVPKALSANAFRDLVDESRYRWMQDLGNLAIATGSGGVQIKKPAAVAELLDVALHAAREGRRVIFYCACEFPCLDGELTCHRRQIADRLLAHAEKIGQAISAVEWPGGEPVETRLKVDRKLFSAVTRGRMSIPFSEARLADFAALPWGSLVALECVDDETSGYALVGPAKVATSRSEDGFWYLSVIEPPGSSMSRDTWHRHAGYGESARGSASVEQHSGRCGSNLD